MIKEKLGSLRGRRDEGHDSPDSNCLAFIFIAIREVRSMKASPVGGIAGQTDDVTTAMKKSLGLARNANRSLISQAPSISEGQPLQIDLTLIDEDPHQPRTEDNPGFSAALMDELAASIKLRGVKTPISLRKHPDSIGRYIINHGARRYRAAKIAELPHIAAFIDQDYTEFDQVVENLLRNDLTAREIADFIGREVAKGFKKGEVAQRIGKSNAFVSQHIALLDLPEPIATIFSAGRVQDVTAINDLVKLYAEKPLEVQQWLTDPDTEFTRKSIRSFREDLNEMHRANSTEELEYGAAEGENATTVETMNVEGKRPAAAKFRKAIVQLELDGKKARLLYDRRPESLGRGWIRYEESGIEASVDLASLKFLALIEG